MIIKLPKPADTIKRPKPGLKVYDTAHIDVAAFELIARLVAEAERRAAKEGRFK